MRQLKDLVVLGCLSHSEAEAGKDGMNIDYEREASIIMLSDVKFVHPWETNSGCNKEVCRWKHINGCYGWPQNLNVVNGSKGGVGMGSAVH